GIATAITSTDDDNDDAQTWRQYPIGSGSCALGNRSWTSAVLGRVPCDFTTRPAVSHRNVDSTFNHITWFSEYYNNTRNCSQSLTVIQQHSGISTVRCTGFG